MKWIKVQDELPTDNTDVLFYSDGIIIGFYDNILKRYFNLITKKRIEPPTHWMPFPSAPEETMTAKQYVLSACPGAYYKKDESGYSQYPHYIRYENGRPLSTGYFTEEQAWANAADKIKSEQNKTS